MMAVAALFAVVGAFGMGFTIGARRERKVAQADVAMWRELCSELHAENGKLRCESTPVPSSGEPPSGKPNALQHLRTRLDFGRGEVAQALGIRVAEVEELEHTRFGALQVSAVERYVGALGCRLDVVAQHIDGAAVWLSDERGATGEEPPACPECGATLARVVGPDGERGWTCVRCEVAP